MCGLIRRVPLTVRMRVRRWRKPPVRNAVDAAVATYNARYTYVPHRCGVALIGCVAAMTASSPLAAACWVTLFIVTLWSILLVRRPVDPRRDPGNRPVPRQLLALLTADGELDRFSLAALCAAARSPDGLTAASLHFMSSSLDAATGSQQSGKPRSASERGEPTTTIDLYAHLARQAKSRADET